MKQEIADRFVELIRDNMSNDAGYMIVYKLVSTMDEKSATALADELEDMLKYPDYLTESEAKTIVSKFENFDGSRGPHWRDASALFDAAGTYGIETDKPHHYNKWAFYTVVNMVWSDDWGVLRNYVSGQDEVKAVAELAKAKLLDRDSGYSVRWYFHLDED